MRFVVSEAVKLSLLPQAVLHSFVTYLQFTVFGQHNEPSVLLGRSVFPTVRIRGIFISVLLSTTTILYCLKYWGLSKKRDGTALCQIYIFLRLIQGLLGQSQSNFDFFSVLR